jgi:hypothetical protein
VSLAAVDDKGGSDPKPLDYTANGRGQGHPVRQGYFQPGGKAGPGRTGPQKKAIALKDALLKAAEFEGSDENGKDGLVGYLRQQARHRPELFMPMLAKVLPTHITATGDTPIQLIVQNMSEAEASRIYQETLKQVTREAEGPLLIEGQVVDSGE